MIMNIDPDVAPWLAVHLFPGTSHGSTGMVPPAGVSMRMRSELVDATQRGLGG